ncbi:MAG TPA: P-loop NTPase [Actinomycetota bacterium]
MALLIVDPDDQSATWLAGILAELAEQLIRTTSPDEAMAAFATEGPDVLGVVVGPGSSDADAVALAGRLQEAAPDVAVVLLRQEGQDSGELLRAALRAGVRDVVTALSDPAAVRGACARALELTRALRGLGGAPDRRPAAAADPARAKAGKLITVFSSKGGCGKTFVATNLALALAAHAEVALVDLDLHFGDVAIMLQLFPARTIQDAARASGGGLDPVTMKSFLTRHQSGLWALVAPSEPTVADTISPTAVVTILRALRQRFGYVVVDTPAAFSDQVLAAFDESDAIAMLATLDVPSIKNLKLALRTMESLRYPRDKTCLVINRADSKVGLRLPDVERILDTQIDVTLPSSRAVPLSINKGSPILVEEPKSGVAEAIRRLADQLATAAPGRPARAGRGRSRRSLFQRS